jgi:DNA primase
VNDKREWVDFRAVKAAVTIQMVLDHYGVTGLQQASGELRGPCPIHRGAKASRHLSVNLSKGAFKCFASICGARGNVLDLSRRWRIARCEMPRSSSANGSR